MNGLKLGIAASLILLGLCAAGLLLFLRLRSLARGRERPGGPGSIPSHEPPPLPPPPPAHWQLTLLTGPSSGTGYPLERVTVIGRATECDIPVDDRSVSRRHARLEPVAEGWVLSDLGSGNGTWSNRTRITGPVLLGDGDSITVGTTNFRLERVLDRPRSVPAPSASLAPKAWLPTAPSGVPAPR